MLYHNVQVTAHALRFIDSTALAVAVVATWLLSHGGMPSPAAPLYPISVFVAVNVLAFLALGLRLHVYHARRTEEVASELLLLCETAVYASALACLATEVLTRGIRGDIYWKMIFASIVFLFLLRLFMRLVIRRLRRKGGDERQWLVVGLNERTANLVKEIAANPHYGIRISEIVDFAADTQQRSRGLEKQDRDLPTGVRLNLVGGVEEIRDIVARRVIDEVVIMLPVRTYYDVVSRILEICCSLGISVRMRPQAFDTLGFATDVSYVGKIPMVTHYNGPSNYVKLLVKRAIDVAGATVGLLVLLPFFLVIAAMIKLDSPGPVFFRQQRVGLHGRHFKIIKFRTMVKDALQQREKIADKNERDGTAFKIRNDSRVTSLGKKLRRFHFDEFPQLWNVLVGDMSLVGPRPFPVNEAHGFEWWQRRRLTMPPGLTCLWQVEDNHKMPFVEWMKLDMAYIDEWSIWLDLKLIVRTFGTVMRGNGW